MDRRDHRPEANAALVRCIAAGYGLRRSAREIGLSLGSTQLKLRKLARHLQRLGRNLHWTPRGIAAAPPITNGNGARGAELSAARVAVLIAQGSTSATDFVARKHGPGRLLTWRQDWGRRSVHPYSRAGVRVDAWHEAPARSSSGGHWARA